MPPGLMDLLMIFLASSSMGEQAAPSNVTFPKKKKIQPEPGGQGSDWSKSIKGRKMRRSPALLLKVNTSPTSWSSSWTRRRICRTGLWGQTFPAPFLKQMEVRSTILTVLSITLSMIIIRLRRLLNLHIRNFYQNVVFQVFGSSLTSSWSTV